MCIWSGSLFSQVPQSQSGHSVTSLATIVYPDTFDGFLIESHEKWSDFTRREVMSSFHYLTFSHITDNLSCSLSPSPLVDAMLISPSKHAVSVAVMSTPSLVDGARQSCPYALATKWSALWWALAQKLPPSKLETVSVLALKSLPV